MKLTSDNLTAWVRAQGCLDRERREDETTLELAYRLLQERNDARATAVELAERHAPETSPVGGFDPLVEKARSWIPKQRRTAITIAPQEGWILEKSDAR